MEYITSNKGGKKLASENNIYIKQKVLSNGAVWGGYNGGFGPGGFCLGDFVLGGILSRGILSWNRYRYRYKISHTKRIGVLLFTLQIEKLKKTVIEDRDTL